MGLQQLVRGLSKSEYCLHILGQRWFYCMEEQRHPVGQAFRRFRAFNDDAVRIAAELAVLRFRELSGRINNDRRPRIWRARPAWRGR